MEAHSPRPNSVLHFHLQYPQQHNMSDDIPQDHMQTFVSMVKQYPILNNKSNTPEARRLRTEAILSIQTRLQDELNFQVSEAQVWKKLQNMKSRVKKKGDLRAMGRMVNLKDWEAEFLDFMEKDTSLHFLDFKGLSEDHPIKTEVLVSECDNISFSEDSGSITIEDHKPTIGKYEIQSFTMVEPGSLMDRSIEGSKSRLPETEETRELSTTELERLVLLEQLKYFRKKQHLADIKIRRELRREMGEAAPDRGSD